MLMFSWGRPVFGILNELLMSCPASVPALTLGLIVISVASALPLTAYTFLLPTSQQPSSNC